MKLRSRATVWAAASILGLSLTGMLTASCGSSGTTVSTGATPSSSTASGSFTILVSNPATYPFYEAYVAISQGFFENRGLQAKVEVVDGTPGLIQGFAAGLGNVVNGDLGSFLRKEATDQFTPVAFYMTTNVGVFDIIVPEDSPIQTETNLNGKVIGINSEEDPGAALVRSLNGMGIKARTLIVGTHLQALAAFDRGDIDAYAGSLPDIAVIQARDVKLRSVAPKEILAANGGSGFWAKRETMDANPAAFKAFVAAIQEARDWIRDDPQKLVDWQNSQEPIPQSEMAFNLALAKAMINLRPTDVQPPGYIDSAVWQTWWDGLVANNVIDPSIGQPSDFFTNEFQSQ